MRADLAIKGGTVVSATARRQAHVYITDRIVLEVGTGELESRRVVDASGLLVLVGAHGGPTRAVASVPVRKLTLDEANNIIAAALAKGRELDLGKLSWRCSTTAGT